MIDQDTVITTMAKIALLVIGDLDLHLPLETMIVGIDMIHLVIAVAMTMIAVITEDMVSIDVITVVVASIEEMIAVALTEETIAVAMIEGTIAVAMKEETIVE